MKRYPYALDLRPKNEVEKRKTNKKKRMQDAARAQCIRDLPPARMRSSVSTSSSHVHKTGYSGGKRDALMIHLGHLSRIPQKGKNWEEKIELGEDSENTQGANFLAVLAGGNDEPLGLVHTQTKRRRRDVFGGGQ